MCCFWSHFLTTAWHFQPDKGDSRLMVIVRRNVSLGWSLH
jgi:hypothetical protein